MAGVVALVAAATASAQGAEYCEGDGGPAGRATDAEHSVLLGELPVPSGVRTSRIDVDGVATRVLEAGPAGASDAVVFVHGHPGDARHWDDLLVANGRFARTIAFDVSGYGQSDKSARKVQSLKGAAGYLDGTLRRLGVKRAVLVLHDFGGPWGLEWAKDHPDQLIGAVLLNTGVFIDYIPHVLAVTWATPGTGEAQMASTTRENFKASLKPVNPRLPDEFIDRMYDGYDRATRCAALRYYRSASLTMGKEQAAVLGQRRRPALVIWGSQDPFIPAEQAEKQRQAFPDAHIEYLPENSHWVFAEAPEQVRNAVVPFLRPRVYAARSPAVSAGRRRIGVRVAARGVVPAQELVVRITRGGKTVGATKPRAMSGRRRIVVRLARPLAPGRYTTTVSARGVSPAVVSFRVVARR